MCLVRDLTKNSTGFKLTAAKSLDEYAKLDAEDESLARWKASLGIVPGAATPATGPKVSIICGRDFYELADQCYQVTVLTLELASSTLPPGKHITFNLKDTAALSNLKKNPILIKEGVEYKYVDGSLVYIPR